MRSKTKYILVIILVAFSLSFLTAGAYAADVGYATILKIGFYPRITPESSGAVVFLDDSEDIAFTGMRMYYLSTDLGNQGLATFLTAFSMDKKVWVRIGGSTGAPADNGSLINVVYIQPD
jgi:hypothetical protein